MQEKHEEEEVELRAVLATEERSIGEEHLRTLGTRYKLARCLRDLGRREEALREAEAAYAGMRKVMEDAHLEYVIWLVEELKAE